MEITAGDLVMALRNGADAPYEINLRVGHRALMRSGDAPDDYVEWLDSMTPSEMTAVRERVETVLSAEVDAADPT